MPLELLISLAPFEQRDSSASTPDVRSEVATSCTADDDIIGSTPPKHKAAGVPEANHAWRNKQLARRKKRHDDLSDESDAPDEESVGEGFEDEEEEEEETSLDLSHLRLGESDLRMLCDKLGDDEVITSLNISGSPFFQTPESNIERGQPKYLLPTVNSIKKWEVVDWSLCEGFAKALRKNRRVTKLDMAGTNLGVYGQKGLIMIAQVLLERSLRQPHGTPLVYLDLSSVVLLGESRMRYNGLSALGDLIRNMGTLETLILRGNFLHTEAVKFIADALSHNTTLTHLDLSENLIGCSPQGTASTAGVHAFVGWLQSCCKLNTLNLSSNHLQSADALELGYSVAHNATLRSLLLAHNNIKVKGIEALADPLPLNETLTELDLSYNRACDDGAVAFLRSLKHNKTLATLRLAGNNITHYAGQELEAALKNNHGLCTLDLSDNALMTEQLQRFGMYIELNRDVKELSTTNNPAAFPFKTRSKVYKKALFARLPHLPPHILRALRDGHWDMNMVHEWREKLVELAPFSRREMLHKETKRREEKRSRAKAKVRAFIAFKQNRGIAVKRREGEAARKRREMDAKKSWYVKHNSSDDMLDDMDVDELRAHKQGKHGGNGEQKQDDDVLSDAEFVGDEADIESDDEDGK